MAKDTLSNILYLVGGIIIILGIVILIGQHWEGIGAVARVAVTLGMSVALYISGVLLGDKIEITKHAGKLSATLHVLAAILLPIGLGVLFDASGFNVGTSGIQSLILGITFATYIASFLAFRKEQFVFFGVVFGTGFFFAFVSFLLSGQAIIWLDIGEYLTLAIGVSHLLLAYSLRAEYVKTSRLLTHTGLIAFLGAAIALSGWKPNQNAFWEIIYPALIFGGLLLSLKIKDRAYLAWSAIFLVAYVSKITSEYFYDSLGWALSLVFAGLFLIFLGWLVLWLNRRLSKVA